MTKRNPTFLTMSVLLLATAWAPAGHAQTGTQVTVLANPAGPWFEVDGTTYFSAMSAFWPVGSLHTLSVSQGAGYSYNQNATIQWQFQQWQWSGGSTSSPSIQVEGNIGNDRFTAMFNVSYLFTTQIVCNPGPCAGDPGTIMVNGNLANNQSSWVSPGAGQSLAIHSNPGWIFAGWQVNNDPVVPFEIDNVSVNGPTTVSALFIPSKAVNFLTIPANLLIYADGTLVSTPQSLPWAMGSSHTLAGLDTQVDNAGKTWIFASWSDGGAQTHTYVVGKNANPETVTATYAAAAYPFFRTSPSNLALVVDGNVLPPPYSYAWGVGSTHSISATTPQKDAQGNTWVFQSWDDGVTTPSRTITIPVGANVNGYSLTAVFTQQTQAQLTVNSTMSGQVVTVNGSSCTTPCNLTFAPGTQVHASAPASVTVSNTSKQSFVGWSTGVGAPVSGDWVATLSSASTSITATYHLMNYLTTSASPIQGGTYRLSPASSDGYYESGTQVSIHAQAKPGFRFSGWSGDLSGSAPSASLTMNVPHSVSGQFSAAPVLSRAGVTNGAGRVPVTGVAAGSVASVYGDNLSAESSAGPAGKLSTTLADVTLHIGLRSVPLYFVSPSQINFQAPPDLATGVHTLTVSSPGMPDVNSDFAVVRNAPGLFPTVIDGQTYAMVVHEDGTPVTPATPASRGELLTAYATGLGPTDRMRPEGLAVPANLPYRVLDPVSIQAGNGVFRAESAFAAPGQVGVDAIQFRLDSTAPSGGAIPIHVIANGVASNTLTITIR